MPQFQMSTTFSNKDAETCYLAAERALPKLGFTIWKTRPLAWLVQARRDHPDGSLRVSVSCRPGVNALVTVNVAADTIAEDTLERTAKQILSAIIAEVSE